MIGCWLSTCMVCPMQGPWLQTYGLNVIHTCSQISCTHTHITSCLARAYASWVLAARSWARTSGAASSAGAASSSAGAAASSAGATASSAGDAASAAEAVGCHPIAVPPQGGGEHICSPSCSWPALKAAKCSSVFGLSPLSQRNGLGEARWIAGCPNY